ncbi:MAG: hypothetical protein NXI31_19780 [bacterium]|nr:hypothetical protein [bacterium]
MLRQTRAAFPAGLYGMLLIAVFGLTLPALVLPVERVLVGTAALVPRFLGFWSGKPAAAAEPAVLDRLAALRADLDAAVRYHDVFGAESLMPAGWRPEVRVAVATGRRGGGGQPSVVQLDRTYAEVADCSEFVTKGNALLGFLMRPGIGLAADDEPDDFARVLLLNDRTAPRVAAAMTFPEGGTLRMIVGPAARVDAAALRAELWDDPYRASRLRADGDAVHTVKLPGVVGEPPGGLLIGRTRIWGYRAAEGKESLAIAVLVAPPIDPHALSHVVLWRTDANANAVDTAEHVVEHAATVWDLPGVRGRHLLACDAAVPDGAAVVQDGLFLGSARGLSYGLALVSSFPMSRQRWSLLLMPDEAGERPRELVGRVLEGREGFALIECEADRFVSRAAGMPNGYLFTGSNGAHCPAGLLLGRVTAVPGRTDRLEVSLPVHRGPRAAAVMMRPERRSGR